MKKIFLAVACALLSVSASFAQGNVSFGAKVGFNLSNFWNGDMPHGMKPGYQAGLFAEYRFANSNFAIAPEIVFSAQGGKFSANDYAKKKAGVGFGTFGDKKITFNTNYINIPVMFKYYVTPDFAIDFGPQLGINVYSKYSIEDVDDPVKVSDNTKDVDFGLGLGGTYNLASNVFLQARYTLGLTKTFKSGDDCNGNIQLAIGYRF